jgi:nitrous oxide reductase accessory protein NosL
MVGMKRSMLVLALLLAACDREERPESPTPAEAQRLDDAEAMLNGLANEEGPATEAADPSNRSE